MAASGSYYYPGLYSAPSAARVELSGSSAGGAGGGSSTSVISGNIYVSGNYVVGPTGSFTLSGTNNFVAFSSPQSVILSGTSVVSVSGTIQVTSRPGNTPALSAISSSITSAVILSGNINRMQAIIVNDSTSTMYIAYAQSASFSLYTYFLLQGERLELISQPIYNGVISAVWSSANGFARVTEVIP